LLAIIETMPIKNDFHAATPDVHQIAGKKVMLNLGLKR